MLRIGVPAATRPRKQAITRSFDSILRANRHGGRFIFTSSSKFKTTQEAAPREQHVSRFEKGRCEMKTKKLIAAALAASIAVAAMPSASFAAPALVLAGGPIPAGHAPVAPFAIMGCAGGIILAALVANARDNRELTAPEAWTCGVAFWFSQPQPHKHRHHH